MAHFDYQPQSILSATQVKQQLLELKNIELQQFNQVEISELISIRTLFCDQLLIDLWQKFDLAKTELALVAVGGYGRQEMFPLSDLDILVLLPSQIDEKLGGKISDFFQFIWDCGFQLGSAVRTVQECIEQGKQEISIATNLLESRFLIGNQSLFDKLSQQLQQPDFWPAEQFFSAKLEEKKARYQRYHNTSYNLEPDIKHNPGGLRDLHLIYWFALRQFNARNLAEILQCGFLYPNEYVELQNAQQYLFKVRFALHLILKRYDNRLLFDRQVKVSQLLGFQTEEQVGNQGVEKMMKGFFQALQSISLFSELLTQHYQEHFFVQSNSNLDFSSAIPLDQNFALKGGLIVLQQPNCFWAEPSSILDLFSHCCAHPDAIIHSATLRQLHLALKQQKTWLSDLPLAREKFLRLLAQPQSIQRAFVPMHRYGVLNAYLPQWQGIQGLMQFDLFHSYTVDEHTLRVMLNLESFLQPETQTEHPLCYEIFSYGIDRSLLYISALFHDIAKGRGGDHAELGTEDIIEFARLHQFEQREIQTLSWLVKQHLLMSITAQRRDIQDPEIVRQFAMEVQNPVRLNLLTCLTVADICATNQTLWNSWKQALFTTLYQYTMQQFQFGIEHLLDHKPRIEEHRNQALSLWLQQKENKENSEWLLHLWQRLPPEYLLRNSPRQLVWQGQLLAQENNIPLVKISNQFASGGTEIFIYCPDQANLFYKVVATIGAKKLSIHDAQIITSYDGYAFDSFIVTELNGDRLKQDRRHQLEQAISQSLQQHSPAKISYQNEKLQHFQVKTEVRFLHLDKQDQTEMELFALDKAGLLAQVSQIFTELKLNILNAKITTIGAKAEDFFILTNQQQQALTEKERIQLELRLKAEL